MTSGKIALTTVTTIALAGAITAGVIYGPRLMHRDADSASAPATVEAPAPEPAPVAKTHAVPKRTADAKAAREAADANMAKRTIAPDTVEKLPATEPELSARLKPVLNQGTRMELAAQGFKDGEQFAAVAHGARNTEIPFVILKHRVLDEHKTLAQAIKDSRPDLNATRESRRAYDAARFDIAVITG
jgi:hypothetical protein